MAKNYLLEVGMEEIPARFLLSLRNQLSERVGNFLKDNRIGYDNIKSFATPRRLALIVEGLDEKQSDKSEEVKGPALRIARDSDGNWTKAASGFARGQKADVSDLIIKEVNNEKYVFVDKFTEGDNVEHVLERMPEVLAALTFPISMNWHSYDEYFIRPIHWIVSLLDNQVIPFSFINITADNYSYGHRFLGERVVINNASTYETQLKEEFVIVNFEDRQKLIHEQIQKLAQDNNWYIPIDEDLLEEVTAIVEWPTAFYGDFDESYLEIPSIILITAMRDHQRYFYALDKETNELLPVFITVRNGNDQHIENVRNGNLKVLKARLEDALFFYQEDTGRGIDFFVEKLNHVKEHNKLGTYADKQKRVEQIVQYLAQEINQAAAGNVAAQAAKIYKFDLMTQVVDEFGELQGRMGEVYAKEFNLDDTVAEAIGEQYLPVSSGGELPQTLPGAMLAFSDKIDTLINYFSIELIPTGSNDPFALRRIAMGLVEIAAEYRWSIGLDQFAAAVMQQLNLENDETLAALITFIKARVAQLLRELHIDHDIIQAVVASNTLNVIRLVSYAKELQTMKQEEPVQYRDMIEALTRVVNLGVKVKEEAEIQSSLSETESERDLINFIEQDLIIDKADPLKVFKNLTDPIVTYFDNNMINSDDEGLRMNRLQTMKIITDFVLNVLDPREIVSKF